MSTPSPFRCRSRAAQAHHDCCRRGLPGHRRHIGWTRLAPIVLLAGALAGCAPPQRGAAGAPPDAAHNSRNALDWAGVYAGVLPCADCPGIETRLTLQRDGAFELSTRYLDRQPAPQTARGRFQWNTAGNTITLDAAGQGRQFRVGEGRLLQLDRDGGVPSWDAPHRVLTLQSRN